MEHLIKIILDFVGWLDYMSIIFLMALESSIFPVPSEVVMIPAWYLVFTWKLNFILVILAGTFGSLLWAIVNYFILGQLIGKPFLLKYWKYILLKEKDYHKAEKLFLENDILYTFLGRLIPVIRHIISIPAWIFKMPLWLFMLITSLWAWLWCAILTVFWYYFGENIITLVEKYTKLAWVIWVLFAVVYLFYKLWYHKKLSKIFKHKKTSN
jgi:membrane protein DedA with SNARE-associated domain